MADKRPARLPPAQNGVIRQLSVVRLRAGGAHRPKSSPETGGERAACRLRRTRHRHTGTRAAAPRPHERGEAADGSRARRQPAKTAAGAKTGARRRCASSYRHCSLGPVCSCADVSAPGPRKHFVTVVVVVVDEDERRAEAALCASTYTAGARTQTDSRMRAPRVNGPRAEQVTWCAAPVRSAQVQVAHVQVCSDARRHAAL